MPNVEHQTEHKSKQDEKTLTKPPLEGSKKFEDMNGLDLLCVHINMKDVSQKSVEEVHKCAVGLSESAACILALLANLRDQAASPIPVLNPVLLNRLTAKLTTYEIRLHVLDLSRDVPRGAEEIKSGVEATQL